jgi:hypothetical protein
VRNDLDEIIDRDEWEPRIAGKRLRFLEMASAELTRYAQRLESVYERAATIIAENPDMGLDEVAEAVLEREDEFFLWLCNLHSHTDRVDLEWVKVELTCGMRRRLLANLDRLNHIEPQLGNWQRLLETAKSRAQVGPSLPTLLEPDTE